MYTFKYFGYKHSMRLFCHEECINPISGFLSTSNYSYQVYQVNFSVFLSERMAHAVLIALMGQHFLSAVCGVCLADTQVRRIRDLVYAILWLLYVPVHAGFFYPSYQFWCSGSQQWCFVITGNDNKCNVLSDIVIFYSCTGCSNYRYSVAFCMKLSLFLFSWTLVSVSGHYSPL